MMNISTGERVHTVLNVSFETQLIESPNLANMIKCNNFQESFEQFAGLGLSSRSFSLYKPVPIAQ